jgi:hypothetical protein
MADVSGTVTLDGEPLREGVVSFIPMSGRAAKGEIQSDGSFVLGTYGTSDGARVGKNMVAIEAVHLGEPTATDLIGLHDKKSLIPTEYNDPSNSQLVYEVKAGESNVFQIELSSKAPGG